jgi:hypothetical protein
MRKYLILLSVILLCQCQPYKRTSMNHKLNFYTQHSQFFMTSDNANALVTGIDWDNRAYEDRLISLNNFLSIRTECYGNVKGELIVLDKPVTDIDYSKYDHIVEAGIAVQSGVLQVLDCPNSAVELEIKVKPGNYRVRVYSSNLASVIDDDGDDYYKIEIWSDDNVERKVLKQWHSK